MKDLSASVLTRLAQRRTKTGEDFNVLLMRFAVERLLYRLYRSKHRDQFILKGAMLFAIWEPNLYRVTRDLDLLGFGNPSAARLIEIFRELCRMEVEHDGIAFAPATVRCEDIRAQDTYAGIRVKLQAKISQAMIPLQVDIGFGDVMAVAPDEVVFPVLLGMAAPKLRAYSRETVVAEKLEALVELGMLNSRFKDYFDLHYIAKKFPFDGERLSKAIGRTFERRGTSFPQGLPVGLTLTFAHDPAKDRGWLAFWHKTGIKTQPQSLENVVQFLVEFFALPLAAASTGQTLHAIWKNERWIVGQCVNAVESNAK